MEKIYKAKQEKNLLKKFVIKDCVNILKDTKSNDISAPSIFILHK
jgi:uncharacterized protein YbcI